MRERSSRSARDLGCETLSASGFSQLGAPPLNISAEKPWLHASNDLRAACKKG